MSQVVSKCTSCPCSNLIAECESRHRVVKGWSEIIAREPEFFDGLYQMKPLEQYSHFNQYDSDDETEELMWQSKIDHLSDSKREFETDEQSNASHEIESDDERSELKREHCLMSWTHPDMKERWDRFLMKSKYNSSYPNFKCIDQEWITFDGVDRVFIWHRLVFDQTFFPSLLNMDQLTLLPFGMDRTDGIYWRKYIYPCKCGMNDYEFRGMGRNLICSVCAPRCLICHQIKIDWRHACKAICTGCPWVDVHDPYQFAIICVGGVSGLVQYSKVKHIPFLAQHWILLDPSNFSRYCEDETINNTGSFLFFHVETNTKLLLKLQLKNGVGLFLRCLSVLTNQRYKELYKFNRVFKTRYELEMWHGYGTIGEALLQFFKCESLKAFCVAVLTPYLNFGSRRLLYEPKLGHLVFDFLMYY